MREVGNQQQGLYRPEFEHDNCGIGAVVNIKGKKTHDKMQKEKPAMASVSFSRSPINSSKKSVKKRALRSAARENMV